MDAEEDRAVNGTEVQVADEGASGEAGAGGRPDDPEGLGFPRLLEGQGGPGSPCDPSGAGGPGNPSCPWSPSVQGDNSRGGPGVLGGPGVQGAVGSAAVSVPTVEESGGASRPGGDAAAAAGGPGSPQIVFSLCLPLQSYLEAQVAHLATDVEAQRHRPEVQTVATVNGCVLTVNWSGEDFDKLRVSVNSCLQRLFLVVRGIRCFWSLFPPTLGHKVGADT